MGTYRWGEQAKWRDWQTDVPPICTWSDQMYWKSYTVGTYWKW